MLLQPAHRLTGKQAPRSKKRQFANSAVLTGLKRGLELGSPPGAAREALLKPLQPRGAAEEERRWGSLSGKRPVWEVSSSSSPVLFASSSSSSALAATAPDSLKRRRVSSSECKPLSYLEYLMWLQEILPESVTPASPSASGDADETVGASLSGLELLRALADAAKPKVQGVPKLSEAEHELAARALDLGDPREVLISKFNVDLTRDKLSCLSPREWLNDEVVNFYCKLLQDRCDKAGNGPSCWFTNTFFWPKLSGPDHRAYSYPDVRRWTTKAKVDIFKKDYVLFPMNIGESHWALGVINLRDKCFHYLDSMNLRPHSNFVGFLQRYLNDEHSAKRGAPLEGIESWALQELDVPQQRNGYDCGVFTCCAADCLASGRAFDYSQDDMDTLRLRLAARIVSGDSQWTT